MLPLCRGSSHAVPYPSHDVGIQRDFICLIWVGPKPHRMVTCLPVHLAVGAALQRRLLSSQSMHCHVAEAAWHASAHHHLAHGPVHRLNSCSQVPQCSPAQWHRGLVCWSLPS